MEIGSSYMSQMLHIISEATSHKACCLVLSPHMYRQTKHNDFWFLLIKPITCMQSGEKMLWNACYSIGLERKFSKLERLEDKLTGRWVERILDVYNQSLCSSPLSLLFLLFPSPHPVYHGKWWYQKGWAPSQQPWCPVGPAEPCGDPGSTCYGGKGQWEQWEMNGGGEITQEKDVGMSGHGKYHKQGENRQKEGKYKKE